MTMKDKNEAVAPSALDLALARVIADCRKSWEGEVRQMAAESRALIAELRADVAEYKLAALEAKAGRSPKS